ncbi:5-oxoprolinase/urea amidolyase family protein [Pseudarthrobacter sp. AL07]|uniref:5-oxoprolinase subunit B/C family protein n=1 Tax=unclassified Pseudarthrobacter TaxID=2647000 RepID=UPI00249A605E|nr:MULTISPECIES: 5-oxoprolinase/urea amidolyase family protein [unclassified Pseudarthrobacter]MDI3195825.1 5-oxoprolinase/urea amidolyase family protein [Pseudarthrobacter sp. AL20]MDI3209921.1 5-oxoprolinase/urea amidolyase family protein [Pseudarthrobacter sp. AL07]
METVSKPAAAARVLAVRPVGTTAVLAELSGLHDVLALQALLLEEPLPGQVDVLAAAETVMVKADSPAAARRMAARLLEMDLTVQSHAEGKLVQIETVYDGDDLAEVGRLTGLGADGVIAAHTGQVWTVAFGGFAPGFSYMVGENHVLEVPRRSSPRTTVPAGSVALAGNYSAVYPRKSPGGWQLIGRTEAPMWDLSREQPALAAPGDRVQFSAVRELIEVTDTPAGRAASEAPASHEPDNQSGLLILSPGLQSLIQDLGRPGHAGLGVSSAGALDRSSLRRANRIVGNDPSAAVVESVAGGLRVQAVGDQVLAVAGAPSALTVVTPSDVPDDDAPDDEDDRSDQVREVPMATAFALFDGEILTIGAPELGFRSYLAIRGGAAVDAVLGSRSTDTMSGIGPAPLAAGQLLGAGAATSSNVVGNPELQPDFPDTGVTVLDIVPGPRDDWFDAAALESLCVQEWAVTPRSNRVGMRLDGAALSRSRDGELPSEGTMAGALQIPPDGQPVLFLADHPITGGYPVIAVVVDHQLDLAAQVPIGGSIRFRWAPGYGLPTSFSDSSPDISQTN